MRGTEGKGMKGREIFGRQLIGGAWVESGSDERIEVENPATRERFASVPAGTIGDADRAVAAARRALPGWSATPLEARIALV